MLEHLRCLVEYTYIDGTQNQMSELVYACLNQLDNSDNSFVPLSEAKKKTCLEVMPKPDYNYYQLMESERRQAGF